MKKPQKTFEKALESAFLAGASFGSELELTLNPKEAFQYFSEGWPDDYEYSKSHTKAFQWWRDWWSRAVPTVDDQLPQDESRTRTLPRSSPDTRSTEQTRPRLVPKSKVPAFTLRPKTYSTSEGKQTSSEDQER